MNDDVFEAASRARRSGDSFALVTITETVNSSPRDVGTKMIVYEDGSIENSIGGGAVEAYVIEQARQALEQGESRKVTHNLEPDELNMYCGGQMEFFIDVHERDFHLLQFGAGHVGAAVARVGEAMGRSYTLVDDREEFADPEQYPGATRVICCPYEEAFEHVDVDERTYISIITRCHDTDIQLIRRALDTPAPYIGMIGSDTKAIRLFRNLEEQTGVNPADDERVFAPIGLKLGGSRPGDIAISVWSEVLKIHSGGSGDHYRLDEAARQRARARSDKTIGDEFEQEPIQVPSSDE